MERPSDKAVRAYLENWRTEAGRARLYEKVAEREQDPRRKELLDRMARSEADHARRWEERLREVGVQTPPYREALGERLESWIMSHLDVDTVLRRITQDEIADAKTWSEQERELDEAGARVLGAILPDEKSHVRLLQAMVAADPSPSASPLASPRSRLDTLLGRETWHKTRGSSVRDLIYGVNDGLGAVFGIVAGVSGYTGGSHVVLIAGVAGMLASALSMGGGAYLAAKSEREVYEAEISREDAEIRESPEEEIEELSLIYQIKGFTEDEAKALVGRIAENPEHFLRSMVQEELGLSTESFPSPWSSALSASASTAVGAIIPVIPFFFLQGIPAIIAAAVVSLAAHFAVGAAKTLLTARSWWRSGMEMVIVGLLEAMVTYSLGFVFRH